MFGWVARVLARYGIRGAACLLVALAVAAPQRAWAEPTPAAQPTPPQEPTPVAEPTPAVDPTPAADPAPASPPPGQPTLHVQREPITIPPSPGPIHLDGILDEPAWQAVPVASLTTYWPEYGKTPSERSEALFAHDDQNLYVAFRNFDSKPGSVKVTSLKRDDHDFGSQDLLAVVIDSFNDNENALAFYTNADAVRIDGVIANDAATVPSLNTDPNMFWDVATHRDEQGWTAEFRIPFSTLRYSVKNDQVTMGMIVYRLLPRTSELSTFPPIESRYSPIKPSRAQDVAMTGVVRRTPFYATPYLLGGYGAFTTVDPMTMASDRQHKFPAELGGDVKLGISSNFTLDATINPDFAQVEADDQQINLTRFNLFFPEKRPFFLERAAVLAAPLEASDRLFYSRKIGILGNQQTSILGGLRGIGRVGGWDLGVMNVQTQALSGVAPSENMGVLRLRRQVLDDKSYVGSLVTTRIGSNGNYNIVGALDSFTNLHKDDYLTVNVAHSWWSDAMASAGGHAADDSLARVLFERRSTVGPLYSLEASRAGAGFVPGLGFLERSNFSLLGSRLGWGWDGDASAFRAHQLSVAGTLYTRNADNSLESAVVGPSWDVATRDSAFFGVSAAFDHENVTQPFSLSDKVSIPAGNYNFASASAYYQSPSGNSFYYSPTIDGGQYFDGYRVAPGLALIMKATKHLVLSGKYTFNYIKFPDRSPDFISHLALLRTLVMINHQLSLTVFAQVNSITGSLLLNARLRFNPSEGHDLYVVYDDSRSYNDRDPTLDRRTLLLKYAYTFDLGW